MLAGGGIDSHSTDGIADACFGFVLVAVTGMHMMVSGCSGAACATVRSNLANVTHHLLHRAP
jgi:hypothetical protein